MKLTARSGFMSFSSMPRTMRFCSKPMADSIPSSASVVFSSSARNSASWSIGGASVAGSGEAKLADDGEGSIPAATAAARAAFLARFFFFFSILVAVSFMSFVRSSARSMTMALAKRHIALSGTGASSSVTAGAVLVAARCFVKASMSPWTAVDSESRIHFFVRGGRSSRYVYTKGIVALKVASRVGCLADGLTSSVTVALPEETYSASDVGIPSTRTSYTRSLDAASAAGWLRYN
mmetsp:Transcript_4190/g.13357  ORF Transcript_4190/g.13357 Transcript_4190/m.13357 type:complete len:236 (-) Transcript_4190:143-850(-)